MIKKIWSKLSPPNPNIKKLQDALGITDKEAKETDALIRSTIGPLEDDIASITKRVSKLIQRYTSSLPEDESALICDELVSYYMKRDKDWMNGEDTFCVIAYIFTFFALLIYCSDAFNLQAIQNQKENRNMYELPQEVQYASVAFFLHETEGRKNHFELSQQAIKETLQQWQNLSTDA